MTPSQVRDDILGKLWIVSASIAPASTLSDIATAITGALQEMWTSPEDYFRRQAQTVNVVAADRDYVLDSTVQEIHTPVRLDGAADLTPIRERGTLNNIDTRFKGELAATGATGTPVYFFVDRKSEGNDADPVVITLYLSPTPASSHTLTFDATIEPPVIEVADFTDPQPDLPVPHQYVHTVLLPIARMHATRSERFFDMRKEKMLYADYVAALKRIGILDPQISEAKATTQAVSAPPSNDDG